VSSQRVKGPCTRPFSQAASNSFWSIVPSLLVSTCAKSSTCAKLAMLGAAPACVEVSLFATAVVQTCLHWSGVSGADGVVVFWAEAYPAVSSKAVVKNIIFMIENRSLMGATLRQKFDVMDNSASRLRGIRHSSADQSAQSKSPTNTTRLFWRCKTAESRPCCAVR
jgi:hypothetical protein